MKCSGEIRADGYCSYCGSISVAKAIQLLKTPGTTFSGSDWKYGWPHKFYIGSRKFYNKHLHDATPEELKQFNDLSVVCFDISWRKEDGKLQWIAPKTDCFYGYQRAGNILEDGSIHHTL